MRRHLHKGLQFLTAKTIKKMPEPVQNVTYRAAWLPINAVRGVKNAALNVVRAVRWHR